jgi:hypothetical protein
MRILIQAIRSHASTVSSKKTRVVWDLADLKLPSPSDFNSVVGFLKKEFTYSGTFTLKSYQVLQELIIKCIPILCSNYKRLIEKQALGEMFFFLNKIKIDRTAVLEMVEK